VLHLQVTEHTSSFVWRWRLLDEQCAEIANDAVDLTLAEVESHSVLDLYRRIWLVDAESDWRAESERAILAPVGNFIGARILGGIASELLARAPITVRLEVPPTAVNLLNLPFELARYDGKSLTTSGVRWSYDPLTKARSLPGRNPGSLRVLALFALPADASALAVVRDRRQLAQTLSQLGAAVQLEVMQYGVTRDAVDKALRDPVGWDILHISGHGSAGLLNLEKPDGTADPVGNQDLLQLLAHAVGRTSLVMLSACESGAARAARLGITSGATALQRDPVVSLQSVGYEVATAMGCSVVAMRYPVDDGFSIEFNKAFYRSLLIDGAALDDALHSAVLHALDRAPGTPLSIATPLIITSTPEFRLGPLVPAPSAKPSVWNGVPAESDLFVGRSETMRAIADTLASGRLSAINLLGMPGIGKTSALREGVALHAHRFEHVLWLSARSSRDVSELEAAVEKVAGKRGIAHLRDASILLILDDAEAALGDSGGWLCAEMGCFIEELAAPGASLRLLLASQHRLPLSSNIHQVVVPMLDHSEAMLLYRQVAERDGIDAPEALTPALVCGGNPGLVVEIGGETRWETVGRDLAGMWEVLTPLASPAQGDGHLVDDSHLAAVIARWAGEEIALLPDSAAALLSLLCSLEAIDRRTDVLEWLWPLVVDQTVIGDAAGKSYDGQLDQLLDRGLVERHMETFLRVHPAVAHVGRTHDSVINRRTVQTMAMWWAMQHDGPKAAVEGEAACAQYAALAVPYLMRNGQWQEASRRAEEAINHDNSTAMAARLLPFINEIVRASTDSDWRRESRYVRAVIVSEIDPQKGLEAQRTLLHEAREAHDSRTMVYTTAAIANILARSDPMKARDWLKDATRDAVADKWAPLALLHLKLKAAKLEYRLGVDAATSAARAEQLADELDATAADGDDLGGVNLHALRAELREFLAETGSSRQSEHENPSAQTLFGGSDPTDSQDEQLRDQFNALSTALAQGLKIDGAEQMLVTMLARFDGPGNEAERALVLGTLAEMRLREGAASDAIELLKRALRADYAAAAGEQAAADHHHLAIALAADGQLSQAALHLCATAVIRVRMSRGMFLFAPSPKLVHAIWTFKLLVARQPDAIPDSYAALRELLSHQLGVDPEALLAQIPRVPLSLDPSGELVAVSGAVPDDADGDSLTDVVALAHAKPAAAELLDARLIATHWQETITAVKSGNRVLAMRAIDILRATGWTDLAAAFERIIDGEGPAALSGLTGIDVDIARMALPTGQTGEPTGTRPQR